LANRIEQLQSNAYVFFAVGQFQVQETISCRVCKGEEPLLRIRKAECLRGFKRQSLLRMLGRAQQEIMWTRNKYIQKKEIR